MKTILSNIQWKQVFLSNVFQKEKGTLDKIGYSSIDFNLTSELQFPIEVFSSFNLVWRTLNKKNSFFCKTLFFWYSLFYENGWKEWHEMFCISARQSIYTNCWFPHASIFWTTSRAGDDVSSHNRCQRHNFSKISELVKIPYTLTLHRDSSARKQLDPQDQTK